MNDDSPYYVPPNCKVVIDGELAFRISKILEAALQIKELQVATDRVAAEFWSNRRFEISERLRVQANNNELKVKQQQELLRQFDAAMRKGAMEARS